MIDRYELAFRMQKHAPEVMDLRDETKATLDLYGIGEQGDRRLRPAVPDGAAAGGGGRALHPGDYTDNSNNRRGTSIRTCRSTPSTRRAVDKPIAGLLTDLKQRGLLEDTLVWWGGEFGRTPFAENNGTAATTTRTASPSGWPAAA